VRPGPFYQKPRLGERTTEGKTLEGTSELSGDAWWVRVSVPEGRKKVEVWVE